MLLISDLRSILQSVCSGSFIIKKIIIFIRRRYIFCSPLKFFSILFDKETIFCAPHFNSHVTSHRAVTRWMWRRSQKLLFVQTNAFMGPEFWITMNKMAKEGMAINCLIMRSLGAFFFSLLQTCGFVSHESFTSFRGDQMCPWEVSQNKSKLI